MIAVVFSEKQHTRSCLKGLLNRIGFQRVFITDSIDEADYFFSRERDKIRLIIFEESPRHGLDAPLSRLIIQKDYLRLTTVLHVSNGTRNFFRKIVGGDALSRIDYSLDKPFGIRQLIEGLKEGRKRRSRLRSKLCILGSMPHKPIVEAMYTHEASIHWKKILFAENLNELKKNLEEFNFRAGAIAVEPALWSEDLQSFLKSFKKTRQGSLTPLLLLGRKATETYGFRDYADLFMDPKEWGWAEILKVTSKRMTHQEEMVEEIQQSKALIKENKIRSAQTKLVRCLGDDENRLEMIELLGQVCELQGRPNEAIAHYRKVLTLNPCNPSPYLRLNHLMGEKDREVLIEQGKLYCPSHPQLNALDTHE